MIERPDGNPRGAADKSDRGCTSANTRTTGACPGGAPPSCDDGNVCTDDSCDIVLGWAKMQNFVLLRLPNRKKDVIEFVPDIELEARHSDEHSRLGQVGQGMAAQVWEEEDFSDWETEV